MSSETSSEKTKKKEVMWGRNYSKIDLITKLGVFALLLTPLVFGYCYISCNSYSCYISWLPMKLINGELYNSFGEITKMLKTTVFEESWSSSISLYFAWQLFQVLFYLFFPSQIASGQPTPAGHVLKYRVNGWRMMVITHIAFVLGVYFNILPAHRLFDLWGQMFILANIFGWLLSVFCFIKANYFPTHPEDCKKSGNWAYDFYMGIELNPRIGDLDFKLYFNGRPGIGAWNLINLSFMAAQYHKYGFVSNSLIAVTALQAIYVADFFWNEDWYLRTIDIAHEHFGWMLSWGDSVWLPTMYTLQGFFLVFHPIQMSWLWFTFVMSLGVGGYALFRLANAQKDNFRSANGKINIWGKPATYVETKYKTTDGKTHKTKLLTSGFWGLARHFNYVGDLAMSLSFCLPCGFGHAMPYFYIVYMGMLLTHRMYRDAHRLKLKYGDDWDTYCKIVPYKIFPFLF